MARKKTKKLKRNNIVNSIHGRVEQPQNTPKVKLKKNRKQRRNVNKIHFYILTRTSGRPNAFKRNHESIQKQTFKNWTQIVSVDDPESKKYVDKYDVKSVFVDKSFLEKQKDIPNPKTGGRFPYNLYFNVLLKKIKTNGWVIFLDDDDYLANPNVLKKIAKNIKSNSDLVVWKMQFNPNTSIPRNFNTFPRLYDVGAPCVAVFSKMAKSVKWDGWKCGDFRYIHKVHSKAKQVRVINEDLVMIGGIGNGAKKDIPNKNVNLAVDTSPRRRAKPNVTISRIRNVKSIKSIKERLKQNKRIATNNTKGNSNKKTGVNKFNITKQKSSVLSWFRYNKTNNQLLDTYSLDYTYHFFKEKLEKNEPFTYLRFGDNDFAHVFKNTLNKTLGNNKTVGTIELQNRMNEAIKYNDTHYYKTYNWYRGTRKNVKKEHYNFAKKYDTHDMFHDVLFQYLIAKEHPIYVKGLFSCIRKRKHKVFVGGLEKKYAKRVIGEGFIHLKTPKKNSTKNINKYLELLEKTLKNNPQVDTIILSAGQLSRIIGWHVNKIFGNLYTILDIGGLIETFNPHTDKSVVIRNKYKFENALSFQLDYTINKDYRYKKFILSDLENEILTKKNTGKYNLFFSKNGLTKVPNVIKNHYQFNLVSDNLEYVNYGLKPKTVAVVMCTWKRIERLNTTLNNLESQSFKGFDFFIWNNNKSYQGKIEKIVDQHNINTSVIHSEENIGGIGRFHYARKIYGNYDYIIFIDDDEDFDHSLIKSMLSYADFNQMASWFSHKIYKDYYQRKRIKKHGEDVDYCGTGGLIVDANLFDSDEVLNCPSQYKYIEDLWLSYYAKYEKGFKLTAAPVNIKMVVDGKNQFTTKKGLRDLKINFWRYLENKYRKKTIPTPTTKKGRLHEDITLIVKTINRPESLKLLYQSIRKKYSNVKIIVVDDGNVSINKNNFDANVKYIKTEFDIGISAGRNLALSHVETPYFVLLDDDFVFTEDTNLEIMLGLIKVNNFDIIGGKVNGTLPFKGHFKIEGNGKGIRAVPMELSKSIQKTDFCSNFFIAKTAIRDSVSWTEELKIREHWDFFYKAWKRGINVGISNKFGVRDTNAIPSADYKNLRMRQDYARLAITLNKFEYYIGTNNKKELAL